VQGNLCKGMCVMFIKEFVYKGMCVSKGMCVMCVQECVCIKKSL